MLWDFECMNDAIKRAEEGSAFISESLSEDGLLDLASVVSEISDTFHTIWELKDKVEFTIYKALHRKEMQHIYRFLEDFDGLDRNIRKHNQEVAGRFADSISELICPVEGRYLERQQLIPMAMDADRTLILAGAGTGKTSTVVGFAKYLLKSGKANADEILFLSYTGTAVAELRSRISKEIETGCDVHTFHQLGRRIMVTSEGKAPTGTDIDLRSFAYGSLTSMLSDPKKGKWVRDYIIHEYRRTRDEYDFGTRKDYQKYIEENPLRTYRGESVKSHGEADIANYLYFNGIDYTYEEPYKTDVSDSEHGQYRPDFHIAGTDVYIEYFGTDRKGNVAPFMRDEDGSARYLKQIEEKRRIHDRNLTVMIELYAYERWEGLMEDKLESELRRNGIRPRPMDDGRVFRKVCGNTDRTLEHVASDVSTAIVLIKGTGRPFDEAFPKPSAIWERISMNRFRRILEPVYRSYEDELRRTGCIDFDDMLNRATENILAGRWKSPYKYIVVDEYQDMSRPKMNLLTALVRSRDCKLMCVGDDWQSIYRFNGGDVGFILDFKKYWKDPAVFKIENTYRFSGEILDVSNSFMSRSRHQSKRKLRGNGPDSKVRFIHGSDSTRTTLAITRVLDSIPEGESVLFLGRNNSDISTLDRKILTWDPKPSQKYANIWYGGRRDLEIRFRTIHSSKGLEADHVFILNNKKGVFPNESAEPRVIGMMMEGNSERIDEERRLMYVALTRARKTVNLVVPDGEESPFIEEIRQYCRDPAICTKCGGLMVERDGRYGRFYGCSNYSKGCRYTISVEDMKRESGL